VTYFSRQQDDSAEPKLIGFVGADGVSSFDLSGSLEAFAAARSTAPAAQGRRCYESVLIGLERKTFVCDAGAVIKAQHTLRTAPQLDTIILPGGPALRNSAVSQAIAEWLRGRAATTRRFAAIGAGIFPLADAGLLARQQITTHWRFANEVARMFPDISVSSGVSFMKSNQFYTCGGGLSGMEMSLALIEEDYGPKTAYAVARELSIDLRPPGTQEQLPPLEYQPGVAERLAELPSWITSRLHRDLTVEVLAERTCLSPRHFYRLFKQTFKSTPAAFVEQLRIAEAQQRLAARRESVESIAAAVGFKSSAVFRRAFGRQRGVPPSSVLRAGRRPGAREAAAR
jgi:transcriptional regulator GlxA family with amidase domain